MLEANALRHSALTTSSSPNDVAHDQSPNQQLASPRHENDSSPLPSDAFKMFRNSAGCNAAQDDDVDGVLPSRNHPETELRVASRFKDVKTDVSTHLQVFENNRVF